jgi:hypothetical protein
MQIEFSSTSAFAFLLLLLLLEPHHYQCLFTPLATASTSPPCAITIQ